MLRGGKLAKVARDLKMYKLYFDSRHVSLNTIHTTYPDRIHRSMVLSKFNIRHTDDVLHYPPYMAMFV